MKCNWLMNYVRPCSESLYELMEIHFEEKGKIIYLLALDFHWSHYSVWIPHHFQVVHTKMPSRASPPLSHSGKGVSRGNREKIQGVGMRCICAKMITVYAALITAMATCMVITVSSRGTQRRISIREYKKACTGMPDRRFNSHLWPKVNTTCGWILTLYPQQRFSS